jgi:hypothetical protein
MLVVVNFGVRLRSILFAFNLAAPMQDLLKKIESDAEARLALNRVPRVNRKFPAIGTV